MIWVKLLYVLQKSHRRCAPNYILWPSEHWFDENGHDAQQEKLIKTLNLNKEICKACEWNDKVKGVLKSVKVPIQFLETIFANLFSKGNEFMESGDFDRVLSKNFGEEIVSLKRKAHVVNFPKFKNFYETHCSHHTYHFQILNCSSSNCPHQNELFDKPIQLFPIWFVITILLG